jgi:signal transduction histidine kinase
LVASIMKFVDGFIPAGLSHDPDKLRDPTPGLPVGVLALSIAAFWLFPPALKFFGRYEVLALVSVQNLMFCILWSCFFYGGVASPTLPWVLVIPLLGFFYLGSSSKLRLAVLGMFLANVLGFRLLYALWPPAVNDMPELAVQGLGITSTLAASLYVAMMAIYYASILSHQSELESEMTVHLATASQLRRATQEAERASAAKAEFVARMSHELRTPLNAIIGYSDLLIEEATDEGDKDSIQILNRIGNSGKHLLTLVNKILDLSKIDAGKMDLIEEDCNVDALIEDIVKTFQADAKAGSNSLVSQNAGPIGIVRTDGRKLRQMIEYLVANGLKFTERGVVTVQTRMDYHEEGAHLVIKVIDTGIGISAKDLTTLFERFSGAQDVTTSKYGGTGLGLVLTNRLAGLLGGKVSVESTLGVGSAFTIDIPATRAGTQDAASAAEPPLSEAIAA